MALQVESWFVRSSGPLVVLCTAGVRRAGLQRAVSALDAVGFPSRAVANEATLGLCVKGCMSPRWGSDGQRMFNVVANCQARWLHHGAFPPVVGRGVPASARPPSLWGPFPSAWRALSFLVVGVADDKVF